MYNAVQVRPPRAGHPQEPHDVGPVPHQGVGHPDPGGHGGCRQAVLHQVGLLLWRSSQVGAEEGPQMGSRGESRKK